MPFFYRTPDLVAYLRREAPLTTKSDVFQLGLVLTELFTGRNPERRADGFDAAIELDPVSRIGGALGAGIAGLLKRMLFLNPAERPPAAELLDPWQGVFEGAIERASELEGRVF